MPKFAGGKGLPQKPVNMKKSFAKLFKYIKSFLPLIIISLVTIVVATIIRLIGPNKLGDITDIIYKSLISGVEFELSAVFKIGITLIILYVCGAICTYVSNFLIARVCCKMSKNLRADIDKKINRLPLKTLDRTPNGDILSTVTNDIDTIWDTLYSSVASLSGAIVLFTGSLLMMFITMLIN